MRVIFLTVFILCCPAPGLSVFALSSEAFQAETQSVGMLSLPPGWYVMSKDESPRQNITSDWTLNVQQTLYAKAELTSVGSAAVLQIFSIWGTDPEGNEKSLPDSMLETNGSLVSGLIGGRYGNVSELGEDVVETALADLAVATYGAECLSAGEDIVEFRFKRAFLYRGEKLVLALLKYNPEFEGYWRGQFEAMLNEWVGSLTLTPMRGPALPPPPPPSLPGEPPERTPPTVQPEQPDTGQRVVSVPVSKELFLSRTILSWLILPGALLCLIFIVRRRAPKTQNHEPEPDEAESVTAEKNTANETGVRVQNQMRMLPTLEEWLAEEHLVLKQPDSYAPSSEAEGEGFDKVHSFLSKVLETIDATESTDKADSDNP
ncbi:MAG: hypothetical protein FWG71_05185 [Synergistaceae bacterium]|nr:hypothetical protein [Synergistaceae bacterium]